MISNDYNVYLCQDVDVNSVSVNGMFKFFVFPYMKNFYNFSVTEISEVYTEDDSDDSNSVESLQKTLLFNITIFFFYIFYNCLHPFL